MAGLGSALKLTSPSAGPSAARIDHLNRQIAELVAQNKEAQARASSLDKSLQAERERGEQAMKDVEAKWRAERAEWQDTVDFIQGAHEIAHLRTRDELHATRIAVMVEQDRVSKERARTVRRDFYLTQSQGQERDLRRDLALATVRHDLGHYILYTAFIPNTQEDLEIAREDVEFDRADASAGEAQKLQVAKAKCAKLEEQKKLKTEELSKTLMERDKLEACTLFVVALLSSQGCCSESSTSSRPHTRPSPPPSNQRTPSSNA